MRAILLFFGFRGSMLGRWKSFASAVLNDSVPQLSNPIRKIESQSSKIGKFQAGCGAFVLVVIVSRP